MNFTTRCAEINDSNNLFRLYNDFICNMNDYDPTDCNMDSEINEWIVNAVNKRKSIIYIAESENNIIGFTRLQKKERTDNNNVNIEYIKLSDLYVMPEFRKMGIASSFINETMVWGKENKAYEIVLNVYESNTNAIRFYTNKGFVFHENISLNRIRMTVKILV